MPVIEASYYTDPACPWSWAMEPSRRRLLVELGANLRMRSMMAGAAARFDAPERQMAEWLDAGERSGMPVDPRLWLEAPPRSSHPACLAVIAAGEQGGAARERALRRVREGLLCERRRLDTAEALLAALQGVPGLEGDRLRRDLESSATLERFGSELEEARALGAPAELPILVLRGGDGGEEVVRGLAPYERWREAALALGGEPIDGPRPSVEEALRRFGTMASAEVAAVCDLPGPRAPAELWRLAAEWRVRPERRLTGELWSLA